MFYYQQKGLLLVSVRFSCQRVLLLVPIKQKGMFTWLMLKGHGAVVSATYGLLGEGKKFQKEGQRWKERESETDTDGGFRYPCAPSALLKALKVKCTWI